MTLDEINLLIAEGDPLMPKGLTAEQILARQEEREQVRLHYARSFLQSPLYKALHDQNPEAYFKGFSTGAVRLPKGVKL